MRAVLAAGYDADETLIGEPFWPGLGNGGVGVIWARLDARGSGKHAAHADEVAAPVDALIDAVGGAPRARGGAERERAATRCSPTRSRTRTTSTSARSPAASGPRRCPTDASLRIRLGFGRDLEPAAVQQLVAERVAGRRADRRRSRSTGSAPTPTTTTRPRRSPTPCRRAHAELHGAAPAPGLFTGTTDARYVHGPLLLLRPARGQPARHRRVGRPRVVPPGGADRRAAARPSPGLTGRRWVRAHARQIGCLAADLSRWRGPVRGVTCSVTLRAACGAGDRRRDARRNVCPAGRRCRRARFVTVEHSVPGTECSRRHTSARGSSHFVIVRAPFVTQGRSRAPGALGRRGLRPRLRGRRGSPPSRPP